MCLINLRKFKPKGYGYKVFRVHRDKWYGMYYLKDNKKREVALNTNPIDYFNDRYESYELGKTYMSSSKKIKINATTSYESGFHIYQDLKDTANFQNFQDFVIVKVSYPLNSIQAVGVEPFNQKVVVSKKMTIEKVIKNKTIMRFSRSRFLPVISIKRPTAKLHFKSIHKN